MDRKTWKQFYLYGEEYEVFIRKFIEDKISTGRLLTVSDFSSIDIIRPSRNEFVEEFIKKQNLGSNLNCLDVGAGIGGICRFLACKGHRVTGIDVLPHYVEIAQQINNLVGLSSRINILHGNICSIQLPSNSFDLITCLAVMMYIVNPDVFKKLASLIKPQGKIYIEDYILLKSNPNEEEAEALSSFICIPIRTRADYETQISGSGLSIESIEYRCEETSIFAWNRAENILRRQLDSKIELESEVNMYAVKCPRILNSIHRLGRDELLLRFPLVCERLGVDHILQSDRLLTWARICLRKN